MKKILIIFTTLSLMFITSCKDTCVSTASATSPGNSGTTCKVTDLSVKDRNEFVASSKSELKNDISIGQGEDLTTLSKLYGCNNDILPIFNKIAKENYISIVNEDRSGKILNILEKELIKNKQIMTNCDINYVEYNPNNSCKI